MTKKKKTVPGKGSVEVLRGMKTIIMMILLSIGLCACARQPEKIAVTHTAMGTVVQQTLYVTEDEQGEQLLRELQSLLEDLEKEELSWRAEDSQVAKINKQAGDAAGTPVEKELFDCLTTIRDISVQSEGALDVTLGKATRLWDLDTWAMAEDVELQEFSVPEQDDLQEALKHTGYESIGLQEGRVILPEGMELNLGAVGKGIACDRIGAFLREQESVTGAVISVGGSILTYGSKPDASEWKVAIVHPREDGASLGMLSLTGEWYISTSGDYERYVEKDGRRYHHIINPENGYPADSGLCSVTILSKNGLLSDALSTACFVLGPVKGRQLAEMYEAEALFVTNGQELIMTEGMKKIFKEN